MWLLIAVGLYFAMRRPSSGLTGSSTHREDATHSTTSSDHVTELAAGEAKDRYQQLIQSKG